MRLRTHLILSSGVFCFISGVYASSFIPRKSELKNAPNEQKRLDIYREKALDPQEKRKGDIEEILNGIKTLRQRLICLAKGNVLEVATGTGKNLFFYKMKLINSLTFTDAEEKLLEFSKSQYESYNNSIKPPDVKFEEADCSELRNYDDGEFDTVVDTFGICSYKDPKTAVAEMVRVCRPGGRLLFLEHGRGKNCLTNKLISLKAQRHLEKWGCYCDRDIMRILKEEKLIEIVHLERKLMGTVYFVVAKKRN